MRAGALRARAIGYFVEPAAPGRDTADPASPLRDPDVRALRPAPVVACASASGSRASSRACGSGGSPPRRTWER